MMAYRDNNSGGSKKLVKRHVIWGCVVMALLKIENNKKKK
jgi:hypothetical protein